MEIISNIILVAIIIGLVEVAKRSGVPTKYLPLLAVVLGALASLVPAVSIYEPTDIVKGIVSGLEAVGLFSGVRASSGLIK